MPNKHSIIKQSWNCKIIYEIEETTALSGIGSRKADGKDRTLAKRTRNAHGSAVFLDDGFGDGEPESGSGSISRAGVPGTIKIVENARKLIIGYSDAGIGYSKDDITVVCGDFHCDRSVFGCVPHGVGNEVGDHMLQVGFVSHDGGDVRV